MAKASDAPSLAALDPAPVEAPPGPAPARPDPTQLSADGGACITRLAELGVVFQAVPPIDIEGECPVPAPLELTALGSGVAIGQKTVLNCRTAEALALWIRDVVIPAAQEHLKAVPTEIAQSSTYVCRTRNNGAEMSEHAAGNAVDIGAIGFAHRPPHSLATAVADEADVGFRKAVLEGSCRYFTTVLAPGSDAAHADHLHLDMAERRNGYRICNLGGATAAGGDPPTTSQE